MNESVINVDSKDQTKDLDSTITDSRETDETSTNLVSTVIFNEESNSTIEIKRTTVASLNVTSEVKNDDFDRMRNNIPSTKVTPVVNRTTLYSTSKQIDEKSTTTVFTNVIDFSYISAEKQKYKGITSSSTTEYITTDVTNNFTMNNSGANIFTTNKLNENQNDSVTDEDIKFSTTEFSSKAKSVMMNSISATTSISGLQNSNDQRLTLPIDFNTTESNEIKEYVSLKETNGESDSHISQEISDPAKSENISFNQNPTNQPIGRVSQVFQKVPWNSVNSTVPSNKIGKPSSDNEIWKYIAISPKVNSATATTEPTSTLKTGSANQSERNLIKTKKRGSSNTNIEKSFRWFYTFAHGRYMFLIQVLLNCGFLCIRKKF